MSWLICSDCWCIEMLMEIHCISAAAAAAAGSDDGTSAGTHIKCRFYISFHDLCILEVWQMCWFAEAAKLTVDIALLQKLHPVKQKRSNDNTSNKVDKLIKMTVICVQTIHATFCDIKKVTQSITKLKRIPSNKNRGWNEPGQKQVTSLKPMPVHHSS